MMDLFTWLEGSSLSVWVREAPTIWAFATIITLHTFGMGVLVGACAVLLRLDLGFAEREIAELGGRVDLARTRRSLYPYFFAPAEEGQIERRLRAVG